MKVFANDALTTLSQRVQATYQIAVQGRLSGCFFDHAGDRDSAYDVVVAEFDADGSSPSESDKNNGSSTTN